MADAMSLVPVALLILREPLINELLPTNYLSFYLVASEIDLLTDLPVVRELSDVICLL